VGLKCAERPVGIQWARELDTREMAARCVEFTFTRKFRGFSTFNIGIPLGGIGDDPFSLSSSISPRRVLAAHLFDQPRSCASWLCTDVQGLAFPVCSLYFFLSVLCSHFPSVRLILYWLAMIIFPYPKRFRLLFFSLSCRSPPYSFHLSFTLRCNYLNLNVLRYFGTR